MPYSASLSRITMIRQLLDIMHHAKQLPLPIYFDLPAQRKAVQTLITAQVAKHRFHRRKAARDHLSARVGIDLHLHQVDMIFLGIAFALQESDLPCLGFLGGTQTFLASLARYAILFGATKFQRHITIDRAIRSIAIEPLSGGANAM